MSGEQRLAGRDMPREILGTRDFWAELRENPNGLAAEICSIDLANLDATLERQAADRAWFTAAYEMAKLREAEAEWRLKRVKMVAEYEVKKARGEVYLRAKGEKDGDTGKPKTVDALKSEVDTNSVVAQVVEEARAREEEAQEGLFGAQAVRAGLRAIVDALDDRKDMLVQLAAKHRDEAKDY